MLIVIAATFQAYQFGRALNIYDPNGWNINGINIGGLLLGVSVNVSIAWAATKLPSISGKARTRSAWISFFALMVLSPSLVAPALWLLLKPLPIFGWQLFLSIGLSVAPDLTIALGGFIAGKSLIPLPVIATKDPGKTPGKKKIAAKVARKRISDSELLAYLAEYPGQSHREIADHFKVRRQAIGPRLKKIYPPIPVIIDKKGQ